MENSPASMKSGRQVRQPNQSDALITPALSGTSSHNVADIPEISVSVLKKPVMSASGPVAETAQVSPSSSMPAVKPAPAKGCLLRDYSFHAPAAQAQASSPHALEFEVQAAPVPEAEIDLSSEWEESLPRKMRLRRRLRWKWQVLQRTYSSRSPTTLKRLPKRSTEIRFLSRSVDA